MAEQQQEGGNRQKIIMGVMVVVVAVIVWQIVGLFGDGGAGSSAPTPQINQQQLKAQMMAPKPAKLAKPEVMSEREAQLMRLQQETEAKYIAALNELQMLKIEKDIANVNKDINKAKLDSVKSQTEIVSLLSPKPEPTPTIGSPLGAATSPTPQQQPEETTQVAPVSSGLTYSVISVSRAHGKWNAVLATSGKLYSVHVGDVMPADKAKVVKIDDSGVTLDVDGKKEKISLVPII